MDACITSEAQWPTEGWRLNQSILPINWQTSAQSPWLRTYSRNSGRISWYGDPAHRINEEVWDYLCTGTVLTYESMPRSPELSNVGSLTTGLRICPKWTIGLCTFVNPYLHSDMYDIIRHCLTMGRIWSHSHQIIMQTWRFAATNDKTALKPQCFNHFISKRLLSTTNHSLSTG